MTAHAVNAAKSGTLPVPLELTPLAGGLGGLAFAILFGYFATKQRATAFAMITLGIGELVTSCALMFQTFFGGEGGVSTNRMIGRSLVGVSYAAPIQVYYLIVAWTAIATALMLLLTRTPLGRMANACRDNFERAQFVGYDPRMVRFVQFSLSGFFAGIAGALYTLTYEIVTYDTVGGAMSANALLMTYIGGVGVFAGPVIGAVLVVLLQSWVSLLSNSWLVYAGVLFILMVTFAPGGIGGLVMMHQPIWRARRLGRLAGPYLKILVPGLLVAVGFVLTVELCSFLTIGAAQGKTFKLSRVTIEPRTALPWVVAALLLVGGGSLAAPRSPRVRGRLARGRRRDQGRGDARVSVVALRLTEVKKSFGPTAVIMGVSLDVAAGSRHAIIGPNGAGKTTLFNLISGRFPASAGRIELHGQRIDGLAPHEITRRGLSRSFQVTSIFSRLSVFENVRCGLLWSRGYRYSFWHLAGPRAGAERRGRAAPGRRQPRVAARSARRAPLLRRAARAGDRHHHRGRRRHHLAGRADRGHEPERGRPRGGPHPPHHRQARPWSWSSTT